MPIIDTHQHLWDLDRFRLPWLKPGTPAGPRATRWPITRRLPPGSGLRKTIYMEVDVDPAAAAGGGRFRHRDLQTGPTLDMVGGVVSGRPAADGFRAYAAQFKGSPYVKGVRQVLHADSTPPGYCLDPKFVRGVQLLGELGLRFDLCMRPAELPDAGKLIDACPGTQFILDHCGNAPVHEARRHGARTARNGSETSPPSPSGRTSSARCRAW